MAGGGSDGMVTDKVGRTSGMAHQPLHLGLTEEELQPFQPIHEADGVPAYLDVVCIQARHLKLIIDDLEYDAVLPDGSIAFIGDNEKRKNDPAIDPYCVLTHRGQTHKTEIQEGQMQPVWRHTSRFHTMDTSIQEDANGMIYEPSPEERKDMPPCVEQVDIVVRNACVRTKLKYPVIGRIVLSPAALSFLIMADKPVWMPLMSDSGKEAGKTLCNDLGWRSEIQLRVRTTVHRKSTLSVAIFNAHEIGTAAHWNGFTQKELGGVYLTLRQVHGKVQKKSKTRFDMVWNEEFHFDLASVHDQRGRPMDVIVEMRCSQNAGGFVLGACKLNSKALKLGQAWLGWVHLDPEANSSNIDNIPASMFLKEALNNDTSKISVLITWRNFADPLPERFWKQGSAALEKLAARAYSWAHQSKLVSSLPPLDRDALGIVKKLYSERFRQDGKSKQALMRSGSSILLTRDKASSRENPEEEYDEEGQSDEVGDPGNSVSRGAPVWKARSIARQTGRRKNEDVAKVMCKLADGVSVLWLDGRNGLKLCVDNVLSGGGVPCWVGSGREDDDDKDVVDDNDVGDGDKLEVDEAEEDLRRRRERRGSLAGLAQLPVETVKMRDTFLGVLLDEEYHL